MSQIKFNCSHCQQHLECDEEFAGSEIPCPACQGLTLVPQVPEKAASSPTKSGMTFVPESWRKPEKGKAAPFPKKTGMTHVPESWRKPPPQAGVEQTPP